MAMGIFDFVKKQLIDVIDWTEPGDGILAHRYPMQDREIQSGAQLTVRETQLALFVNERYRQARFFIETKGPMLLTGLVLLDITFRIGIFSFLSRGAQSLLSLFGLSL